MPSRSRSGTRARSHPRSESTEDRSSQSRDREEPPAKRPRGRPPKVRKEPEVVSESQHKESPAVEDGSPSVQNDSPTVEDGSPTVEVGSPTVEVGSPTVEDGSPTGEDGSPTVEDGSPTGEDGAPTGEDEDSQIEDGYLVDDGSLPLSVVMEKIETGEVKGFCAVCFGHWPKDDVVNIECQYCKRVFHSRCISSAYRVTVLERCPECRIKTVDGTRLKKPIPQPTLTAALRMLCDKVDTKIGHLVPDLKAFVCPQFRDKLHLRTLDLAIMEDLLYQNPPVYHSTSHFFSDVRLLYQNYLVFGRNLNRKKQGRAWYKFCESELMDIEACVECYLKADDDDVFIEACADPHPIVWAKMKGYPYWPAKVLKIIDGKCNVRFFGRHEKYRVLVKNCLEMSRTHPSKNAMKRTGCYEACEELDVYITKYIEKVGSFPYGDIGVPFKPGRLNIRTKRMYRKKDQETPEAPVKRKRRPGRPPKFRKRTVSVEDDEGEETDRSIHNISSGEESEEVIELAHISHKRDSPAEVALPLDELAHIQMANAVPSCSNAIPPAADIGPQHINHVELDFCIDERDAMVNHEIDSLADEADEGNEDSLPPSPSRSHLLPSGSVPNFGADASELDEIFRNSSEEVGLDMFDLKKSALSLAQSVAGVNMFGLPVFDNHIRTLIVNLVTNVQHMFVDLCTGTTEKHNLFRKKLNQTMYYELEKNKEENINHIRIIKRNFAAVSGRITKGLAKREQAFSEDLALARRNEVVYLQKIEAATREIEGLLDERKKSGEEFQTKREALNAEWEKKMQEKIEAMELAFRDMEKYTNELETQLQDAQSECVSLRDSLSECVKEKEGLKSRLEKRGPDLSYAEVYKGMEKLVETQSENLRTNLYQPIMQRLNVEEARQIDLKSRVTHLETAVKKTVANLNSPAGEEMVSCETESTISVQIRSKKKEWNAKHASAAAAEGMASGDWEDVSGSQTPPPKQNMKSKSEESNKLPKSTESNKPPKSDESNKPPKSDESNKPPKSQSSHSKQPKSHSSSESRKKSKSQSSAETNKK